jgi:hypothetical protein
MLLVEGTVSRAPVRQRPVSRAASCRSLSGVQFRAPGVLRAWEYGLRRTIQPRPPFPVGEGSRKTSNRSLYWCHGPIYWCHGPIDRGQGGASVLPRGPRILFLFFTFFLFSFFNNFFFHKLCAQLVLRKKLCT